MELPGQAVHIRDEAKSLVAKLRSGTWLRMEEGIDGYIRRSCERRMHLFKLYI